MWGDACSDIVVVNRAMAFGRVGIVRGDCQGPGKYVRPYRISELIIAPAVAVIDMVIYSFLFYLFYANHLN